jgi:hypothetical protein
VNLGRPADAHQLGDISAFNAPQNHFFTGKRVRLNCIGHDDPFSIAS